MNSGVYWCEHAVVAGQIRHAVTISIRNGVIDAITPNTEPGPHTRLDGLTVAGFANAHSHAFHRVLRSRTQADRGTFWTWRDVMYEVAAKLDPNSYHRLARAVFAEMVEAGMSAVGEFHYVHHQPDGTAYDDPNAMGEALLAAAGEAGIRITLLDTMYQHGGLDEQRYTEPVGVQRRYCDPSPGAWAERVDELRSAEHQRIGAAIHSVRAVDPAAMSTAVHWAAANHAPLHAHVSEQRTENEQCRAHHGCSPTELLSHAGVFDETNFTAVHATHLTDVDLTLFGGSSASVCICPTTERDLGDGIGPTQDLANSGVPMCLGSDSHAVIDQLDEARSLELHERLRAEERGVHSAQELLRVATVNGHRSLGWVDAGELAVDQRGDLSTIDLNSVRTAGASTELAIETAMFAATAADITDVVIDGVHQVRDSAHTQIDTAAELRAAIEELVA